jgi:hypothetical protein
MNRQNPETIVVPIISQKNYRACLSIGIIGIVLELVIMVVRWVLYPQYIVAVLRGLTITQSQIEFLIFNINSLTEPISILIGLGFFGIFGRNGMKEGYLFLLMVLFSTINYPMMYSDNVGYLLFQSLVGVDMISTYIRFFIPNLIMFLILFIKSELFIEQKFLKASAILLLLSPIVEFVWFYLSEPFRFYYDPLLGATIGNMASGIIVAIPNLIVSLVSAVIFLKLFYKEMQADNAGIPSISEATGSEADDLVTISPPLVDTRITKYLLIIGIIGAISMFVSFIMQSVLWSQFYELLFSDGLLATSVMNQSFNLVLTQESTINLALGIGLFGVFAKNGQRIGYIFLIIFFLPVDEFLYSTISSIVLSIQSFSSTAVIYYGSEISVSIILAMLLWKNKIWVEHKIVLGITSLALVLFEIIQVLWNIAAADLSVQYDYMNLTVEGSYANAMLYITPHLILNIVMPLIYLILITTELKSKEFRKVNHIL